MLQSNQKIIDLLSLVIAALFLLFRTTERTYSLVIGPHLFFSAGLSEARRVKVTIELDTGNLEFIKVDTKAHGAVV